MIHPNNQHARRYARWSTRWQHGQSIPHSLIIAAGALSAIAMTSCVPEAASEPPSTVEIIAPDPDVLHIPPDQDVELATVEAVEGVDRVRFNGVVAPDIGRSVQVGSLATGRVLEVHVRLGQQVRKGELLLTAQSPELASVLAEAHKADADAQVARRALERARALHERGAIAEKELVLAVEEEAKAAVEQRMARERVLMLGGDPEAYSPRVELRAPISGTVIEQRIAGGDALKSLDGEPLFVIADLSRVWVVGDLHENELARVRAGHRAEVQVTGAPGRVWRAGVADVSRVLDPGTRTAKVRVELENGDGMLRPGMFASVLASATVPRPMRAVPATAVVHVNDRDWVLASEAPGRFRRVAVRVGGPLADGRLEVLEGVAVGERVVTTALDLVSGGDR